MKPHETNGPQHQRSHDGPQHEVPDPLTAAEELRAALAEATARAARLVNALKAGRKEKKALSAVWAGLKQLNLGPNGTAPRT